LGAGYAESDILEADKETGEVERDREGMGLAG
jgi:hypothetical protein